MPCPRVSDLPAPVSTSRSTNPIHALPAGLGPTGHIAPVVIPQTLDSPDGYKEATLRANIADGSGRTGDGVNASITFAGMSVDQAKRMVHTTGDISGGAGKYLYILNQGV